MRLHPPTSQSLSRRRANLEALRACSPWTDAHGGAFCDTVPTREWACVLLLLCSEARASEIEGRSRCVSLQVPHPIYVFVLIRPGWA